MTKSQVTKGSEKVRAGAGKAQVRARQQARQAAAQMAPLASAARVTARQSMHGMRSWAAPRIERSGQALQDRVAPRMSEMMSSAARRIDPNRRPRRRWPFLMGGLAALAAAAGAIIMRRRGSLPWRSSGPAGDSDTTGAAQPAETAGADGERDARVRTS